MIQRLAVAALAAGLGHPLLAPAQTVSPAPERSRAASALRPPKALSMVRPPKDTAIALLSKRVEKVDWDEKPFEEVIGWLESQGEGLVNVVPRWTALDVVSVDRDSPVTLKLRNVTVAEVLLETFDQLSEDEGELALRASGNLLKLSTGTDFGRKLELRVYDVTDLLFKVPNLGESAPQVNLQTVASGSGGGGGGGQSIFQGGGGSQGGSGSQQGGEQAERELEELLEDLKTLIQETIAPETWDTGQAGGRGHIGVFNNALIVVNTVEVHEKIAGLFSR